MEHYRQRSLYMIVSVIGLGLSLCVFVFSPPDFSSVTEREQESVEWFKGVWHSESFPLHHAPIWSIAKVEWLLRLSYPNRAEKNSTILVSVTPEIKKVEIKKGRSSKTEEKDVRKEIWKDLESGVISMALNLPSAKISPDKLVSFSQETASGWSVYFPTEGIHRGIVTIDTEERRSAQGEIQMKQTGETTIEIEIFEPILSLKNILSFLGLVLGPLVSIPGMYAFLRERRRDKEIQRKTEAEKEKRRIIVPR